uniref:NADH-ubiquinone oxidoreductase chain 6 n=2 Tax=Labridae TaxID=8247 RepID=B9UDG5_9LABR|nr:NADH dehydrogenase subunit 6 [Pteragogus flagellifer]YP_002587012.1 NADH dehydrogenase subunit 6 [Pseudolabrus eoethinus]ABN10232.1 NADH dehydrogenase subunit 6 [Pteragogus flagellifer]ACB12510.1 NADH dehydrogenase subunit 6 [Pseudolabrus eoethinus]
MFDVVSLFLIGLVLGLAAVAANPSPYFAALGLVVVAGMGCGVLVGNGGPFLSLVLFLIYLGGMLVVFAYSAALAAEPYPEGWFNGSVALYMGLYLMGVGLAGMIFRGGWYSFCLPGDEVGDLGVLRGEVEGVALMYSWGGGLLALAAWVLLLTLLVVLELTRGLGRGTIRAV